MAQRVKKDTRWGLFRRSVWHGHINYSCEQCSYATLDALKMATHLRAHGVGGGRMGAGVGSSEAVVAEPVEKEPAAGREPVVLVEDEEVKL